MTEPMSRTFVWPSDDGWPYPDGDGTPDDTTVDPSGELDEEIVSLHAAQEHLFDDLDATERRVVEARFGLGGTPTLTLRELSRELGVPRDDLRLAYGTALGKLREHLSG